MIDTGVNGGRRQVVDKLPGGRGKASQVTTGSGTGAKVAPSSRADDVPTSRITAISIYSTSLSIQALKDTASHMLENSCKNRAYVVAEKRLTR